VRGQSINEALQLNQDSKEAKMRLTALEAK
jgi:hypothetical protein